MQKDRITIWRNQKRQSKHPDLRGFVTVNGEDYEVALWVDKDKADKWSGTVQPKQERERRDPGAYRGHQEDDDDIPF